MRQPAISGTHRRRNSVRRRSGRAPLILFVRDHDPAPRRRRLPQWAEGVVRYVLLAVAAYYVIRSVIATQSAEVEDQASAVHYLLWAVLTFLGVLVLRWWQAPADQHGKDVRAGTEVLVALGGIVFSSVLAVRWDRAVSNREHAIEQSRRAEERERIDSLAMAQDKAIEAAIHQALLRNFRNAGQNLQLIDREFALMREDDSRVRLEPLLPLDDSWCRLMVGNMPKHIGADSSLIAQLWDLADQTAYAQACIETRERIKTNPPRNLKYTEAVALADTTLRAHLQELLVRTRPLLWGSPDSGGAVSAPRP